jgi:response regulator NasT
VEALEEAECHVVARLTTDDDISKYFSTHDADLMVVNTNVLSKTFLDQLHNVTQVKPMPIVMFVDKSESKVINMAVKAGVSAFVVDGLAKRRIKPVLDVAFARFEETSALREELNETRASLENQKLVDQAKAIIMKQRNIDENSAYKELRTMAMNKNMRIHEVARNVLNVAELLT